MAIVAALAATAISTTASSGASGPAGKHLRSFFGVNFNFYPSAGPRIAKRMASGGVGSVLFGMDWSSIEVDKGTYDWAPTDRTVKNLARHGVQPIPVLYGSPTWAVDSSAPPTEVNRQPPNKARPHRRGLLPLRGDDGRAARRQPAGAAAPDRQRGRLHRRRRPAGHARADVARRDPEGRGLHGRGDPGRAGRRRRTSTARSCSRRSPTSTTTSPRPTSRARSSASRTLKAAIRRATHRRHAQPGPPGSAFKNKGVQPHARRRRRLPAVAARRPEHRGHAMDGETPAQRKPTSPSRSPRSPSRSRPTRTSAS